MTPSICRRTVRDSRSTWRRSLAARPAPRYGSAFHNRPRSGRDRDLVACRGPHCFQSEEEVSNLYVKPSNGATPEEPLLSTGKGTWANDWSRDGRFLLYSESEAGQMNLWAAAHGPAEGKPQTHPLATRPVQQEAGAVFPKRPLRRLLLKRIRQTRNLRPAVSRCRRGKWPISSGGGVEPRWSKDGNELFYFSGRKLMSVEVKTTASIQRQRAP